MDLPTINELIAASRPRSRVWQGPTLALLGISALLGAFWAAPRMDPMGNILGWLLPQLVVAALVLVLYRQWNRQQRLEKLLSDAMEAVQLQNWPRAEALLFQLLGQRVRRTTVRTQGLLALAAATEASHLHEATEMICRHILESDIGNALQRHTAQVALAGALLRTGQITDAVNAVDRLARRPLPGPLHAQVELLSLFREVTMGHPDLSVTKAEQRSELFRQHLGTHAGYGYGLLAAAYDAVGQPAPAGLYWHKATLLLPVDRLVDRFRELQATAGRYPAAEHPI